MRYGILDGKLEVLTSDGKLLVKVGDVVSGKIDTEPRKLPWWFWQVGTASGQFQASNRSEARAVLKRKINGSIPKAHRLEKVEGQ